MKTKHDKLLSLPTFKTSTKQKKRTNQSSFTRRKGGCEPACRCKLQQGHGSYKFSKVYDSSGEGKPCFQCPSLSKDPIQKQILAKFYKNPRILRGLYLELTPKLEGSNNLNSNDEI